MGFVVVVVVVVVVACLSFAFVCLFVVCFLLFLLQ